jgi:enolase
MGAEVFHASRSVLKRTRPRHRRRRRGRLRPRPAAATRKAIEVILEAIEKAGYKPGEDVVLALDPGRERVLRDDAYVFEGRGLREAASAEMVEFYARAGSTSTRSSRSRTASPRTTGTAGSTAHRALGDRSVQLVGDDLFVTNTEFARGIERAPPTRSSSRSTRSAR